ncbi:hypothetical protein ACIRD8_08865 [Streptomyces sp. NPDC102451]|uniref:hypothetical protein n=1 Tax=Streptomyces sp. NPDC102451 TaxID=3366177 RepID=UPI00380C4DC4
MTPMWAWLTGRMVRPSATYVGPGTRDPRSIPGYDQLGNWRGRGAPAPTRRAAGARTLAPAARRALRRAAHRQPSRRMRAE